MATENLKNVASNLLGTFSEDEKIVLKHVALTTVAIVVFTTVSFTHLCTSIGYFVLLLAVVLIFWLFVRVDPIRRTNFIDKIKAGVSLLFSQTDRTNIDDVDNNNNNSSDGDIDESSLVGASRSDQGGDWARKLESTNPYFKPSTKTS